MSERPTNESAKDFVAKTGHETGPSELSSKEVADFTIVSVETIGSTPQNEITPENFRATLEQSIVESVRGLPERLAEKVDTIDLDDHKKRVEATLEQIRQET